MKRLFISIFSAIFLLITVVLAYPSLKVHAAPAIPACTSTINTYTTTVVNVPDGQTETWLCDWVYIVFPGTNAQQSWRWQLITSVYPNPSFWTNYNTGMEMDVSGASTSNGAQIIQWPYNGQNNQRWSMHYSNFTWNAANVNSGSCLSLSSSGPVGQGTLVVQRGCDGNGDQLWNWVWTGSFTSDGWPVWNIIGRTYNMCIGITGASQMAGAHAVQWACNGSRDQGWD